MANVTYPISQDDLTELHILIEQMRALAKVSREHVDDAEIVPVTMHALMCERLEKAEAIVGAIGARPCHG